MFGDWGQLALASQICVNCRLRPGLGDIFHEWYDFDFPTVEHKHLSISLFSDKTITEILPSLIWSTRTANNLRSLARLKPSGTMNLLRSSHRWKAGPEKLEKKQVDSQTYLFEWRTLFSRNFQEFLELGDWHFTQKDEMRVFFNIVFSYSTWCICEIGRLEKRLGVVRTVVNHREITKISRWWFKRFLMFPVLGEMTEFV